MSPSEPPATHSIPEGIPAAKLSPDQWQAAQKLFESMLDSKETAALLAGEPDPAVRAVAERLFCDHGLALKAGFLDETITLIQHLTAPGSPRFAPGQLLAGRFEIKRLLGAGGMGEVYLARDEVLDEQVAVKTIRRNLAQDQAVRSRFIAEIQNARRVTHRNVCRIFDLFAEGDAPFFSMQYVEGMRLSEWLSRTPAPQAARRRVALELCEGLDTAHRSGILHCDFKPANVVLAGSAENPTPVITDFGLARAFSGSAFSNKHSLVGGTPGYMAPELVEGAPASVRTDIYALGKVVLELLPGYGPALACIAEHPEERPASLEPLIRRLRGDTTRRVWLASAAATGFGGLAGYEVLTRPRLALASRERLALNWFRPEDSSVASLLRNLLITALRQSLLVNIVADDRLSSALARLNSPARLPARHSDLVAAAEREGIAFVAEGTLTAGVASLRFVLQVFRPGETKAALAISEAAANSSDTVWLAEQIARKLRHEFGESAAMLSSGYVPLDRLTSPSAEAAAYYFRGLGLYESADAEAAIDWFDQALRIDRQFALAHLSRGIALAARFQWSSAIPSYQSAFDLRSRVSERERLWIEGSYYNIIGDYVSSLASFRRLTALYPDEAIFQRNTAFAYAANGRSADALPYNRRALELDPTGVSNASELIVNHAAANQYDEALAAYQQARQDGVTSTLLERGAGLAWMGKGEPERALQAFDQMGSDAKRERWARLLRCAPMILEGRFGEAASLLESDLAWDVARNEQSHLVDRRIWLGHLDILMDAPTRAQEQAAKLVKLGVSPAFVEANRQAALLAIAAADRELAHSALDQLSEIERRWPSTHTHGLRAHIAALTAEPADGTALFSEAYGLWADPPLLLSRAQWRRRNSEYSYALADCEELNRQEGRLLKLYFPGLAVLGWIEQARCLAAMSQKAEALRVYQRVNKYWHASPRGFRIVQEVAAEMETVMGR